MHWSVRKINNVYAKLLILLPNIWIIIFLPLLKSLYGIESYILWNATCSQIFQHLVFVPWFRKFSARTQQIFLIDGALIRGIGHIDVPLISIFFSSIFDCWVIFMFWNPTILFDESVHQSPQTIHAPLWIIAFLKGGNTVLSLFFRQFLHNWILCLKRQENPHLLEYKWR